MSDSVLVLTLSSVSVLTIKREKLFNLRESRMIPVNLSSASCDLDL